MKSEDDQSQEQENYFGSESDSNESYENVVEFDPSEPSHDESDGEEVAVVLPILNFMLDGGEDKDRKNP